MGDRELTKEPDDREDSKKRVVNAVNVISNVFYYLYHGSVVGALVYLFIYSQHCDQLNTRVANLEGDLLSFKFKNDQLMTFYQDVILVLEKTVSSADVKLSDTKPSRRGKREIIGRDRLDISSLLRGRDGDDGAPGPPGPPGHAGVQGPPGTHGPAGIQGSPGHPGLPGRPGPQGKEGHDGLPGRDAYNLGAVTHYINTTISRLATEVRVKMLNEKPCQCLKGDPGTDGRNGTNGKPGVTGPSGLRGTPGSKGEQGITGDRGNIGLPGTPGAQGQKGEQGLSGRPGSKGDIGSKGDSGKIGIPGQKGEAGQKGSPGARGAQGENGLKGAKGETGLKGDRGLTGGNDFNRSDCVANKNRTSVVNGAVRLNGKRELMVGETTLIGTVETFYNGTWGYVCDDTYSDNFGKVVCSNLGMRFVEGRDGYRVPTDDFIFDHAICGGTELYLTECSYETEENCSAGEGIFVRCDL